MKTSTKKLTLLATAATLVLLCTWLIKFPSSLGYKNLGDAIIFFTALFFGPYAAAIAGGIGAALADIIAGYAIYALPTLIIKALEGYLCGFLFCCAARMKFNMRFSMILSMIPAALLMAGGYYLFNGCLYGFAPALIELPGDLLQGAVGILGAYFLSETLMNVEGFQHICGGSIKTLYRQNFCRGCKKIAVVTDLSGIGRCSLAVALPVLACMRHETVSLPTAILSNQTGYDSYYMSDLSEQMERFGIEWAKIGVSVDALLTGYTTGEKQIEFITELAHNYAKSGTKIFVDPILGDGGNPYNGITESAIQKMKELVSLGDYVFPNLTEACLLCGYDYDKACELKTEAELAATMAEIGKKLADIGAKNIIITGIPFGEKIYNYIFSGGKQKLTSVKRLGGSFSGTGDIYAAIICGGICKGYSLQKSNRLAVKLIKKSIKDSLIDSSDPKRGVNFEKYLYLLN